MLTSNFLKPMKHELDVWKLRNDCVELSKLKIMSYFVIMVDKILKKSGISKAFFNVNESYGN